MTPETTPETEGRTVPMDVFTTTVDAQHKEIKRLNTLLVNVRAALVAIDTVVHASIESIRKGEEFMRQGRELATGNPDVLALVFIEEAQQRLAKEMQQEAVRKDPRAQAHRITNRIANEVVGGLGGAAVGTADRDGEDPRPHRDPSEP